jgi:hypothetical protein
MIWTRGRITLVATAALLLLHSLFVPRGRDPGPYGEAMLASTLVFRSGTRRDPSWLTVSLGIALALVGVLLDSSVASCKDFPCIIALMALGLAFLLWDKMVGLLR